ncbi:hypothetical protein E2C01_018240 [Portunus trituberculatus]|uniref:Uncharacterized protein n=1 Tax=Portunus trituberculatus TaxID=210409 RepID=A0A5B7DVL4_PORTR|nr:hypothetical protein [Portunus trituberculatus]
MTADMAISEDLGAHERRVVLPRRKQQQVQIPFRTRSSSTGSTPTADAAECNPIFASSGQHTSTPRGPARQSRNPSRSAPACLVSKRLECTFRLSQVKSPMEDTFVVPV